MDPRLENFSQLVTIDMNRYGFCVLDNFMGATLGNKILAEVKSLYASGEFRAGQMVNHRVLSNPQAIRGDYIRWVLGVEPNCAHIGLLMQTFDAIMIMCDQSCDLMHTCIEKDLFATYSIHSRTKAMVSCYPGNNASYAKHYDNPNADGRRVTCIYYLNKDYERERDGGVLRIHPRMVDRLVADVEPIFDRAIFFWSDRRNPHEVMPSKRDRFAISIWYYDDHEFAGSLDRQFINKL